MVKVQYLGISPLDLEGFPAGIKRSKEGALHLKPKCVYTLEDLEFAHVKKIRPDLKFHVYNEETQKVETKKAEIKETPKVSADKPKKVPKESEKKSSDKK